MNNKYKEIMENITVTNEMKDRILKNIKHSDYYKHKKIIQFSRFKKITAVAACFALMIVGSFVIPKLSHNNIGNPPVQVVPDIKSFSSVEQLSDAMGFEIEDIKDVTFSVNTIKYMSYWDKLAEITYEGKENSLAFRKSKGTEDNSGDYNEYSFIKNLEINNISITLKGNSLDNYNLAIWNDNQYSYSIYIDNPLTKDSLVNILADLL